MTDGPPTIRHLDDRTVQQIAAGEVVERPSSVVKELLENSLDAGASRLSIAIEGGGAESIRVRDDGVGIPRDQLRDAVAEHATSKIGDVDDLAAGVATLGFRGEALHAIGAVSKLTVRSRPRGADVGSELTVEGGDVGDVQTAGCPDGTTVEVEDLFYNTPARKKFLSRETTETDRVQTVATQYALANPDVAISFEVDDRQRFATPGDGKLQSAVLAIYGREVAEGMIEVDVDDSDPAASGTPVTGVHGLVSEPETTRATREYLATFVNGRYVTVSDLRNAVLDGYGGQLAPDRYPFAVLFVDLPPEAVDANVHPRKLEVRFDDPAGVQSAIEIAVREALLDHGLVRSGAARGRSAPDETPVTPDVGRESETQSNPQVSDRADITETDRSETQTGSSERPDKTTASASNATHSTSEPPAADATGTTTGSPTGTDAEETVHGESATDSHGPNDPAAGTPEQTSTETDATRAVSPTDDAGWTVDDLANSVTGRTIDRQSKSGIENRSSGSATDPSLDTEIGVSEPTSQRTLTGESTASVRTYDSLPSMSVLGQLFETYVLAETTDGLVLIDQHAADERINYERLREAFAEGPPAQALAEPVELELTAREATLFDAEDVQATVSELGFEAESIDDRTITVHAVPAVFDTTLDPALLQDALLGVARASENAEEPIVDAVDDLLADLACYPSVTGNTALTDGSVVDLLRQLDACENPYACPHGRPAVIEISRDEIEDRFERDYPGHAERRRE